MSYIEKRSMNWTGCSYTAILSGEPGKVGVIAMQGMADLLRYSLTSWRPCRSCASAPLYSNIL